jgi:hypothetical protein
MWMSALFGRNRRECCLTWTQTHIWQSLFDISPVFRRAQTHFSGIPADILPGRFRGHLTAVVVLMLLSELDHFIDISKSFLVQGWFDTLFILNEERTGTGRVRGIEFQYLNVSQYFNTFPPGFDGLHSRPK